MLFAMWRAAAFLSAFVLTGCVQIASPEDLRVPTTAAELAEFEAKRHWIDGVVIRIAAGNHDLCPVWEPVCHMATATSAAAGIGAFADKNMIYITQPLLRMIQNDHELAVILGHEQAHRFLKHWDNPPATYNEGELASDCVGAVIAEKAGLDAIAGADIFRRLDNDMMRDRIIAFAVLGVILPGVQLDLTERRETITRAALTARKYRAEGRPLDRAGIGQICGVAF